jgi:sortase (surface protein transpeptidase)
MNGRLRTTLRIVGSVLLVGALAGWIAAGSPGFGASEFGAGPDVSPASAEGPPDVEPDAENEAESDEAHEAEPDAATAGRPADDGPRFTTTAPRGAIDRATWPSAVRIPALRVDAPVQVVGVGTEGALIVPHSPMDVGWYQGGSVPGEAGVALLTSHVDTRTEGRGVFAGLVDLEEGDEVTIVTAEGVEQRWTITGRTRHLKSELPPGLFARSGPPVLALVTCGGPFDRQARSYRDNVIVWAEPTD